MTKLTAKNVKFTRSVGTTTPVATISSMFGETRNWGTEVPTYQKISGQPGHQFGESGIVSPDGNVAFVGARVGVSGTNTEGAVYVYENNNGSWTLLQSLTPSDVASSDYFYWGLSCSQNGDKVFVSSPYKSSNNGAVYVFERINGTYTEIQKINPPSGYENDNFGWHVSCSYDGNTLITNTPQYDDGSFSNTGAVHVYVNQAGTYTHSQTIQGSIKGTNFEFGSGCAISGDGNTIVAGARRYNGIGTYTGTAFIFEVSGGSWTETQRIESSSPVAYEYFGEGVAINYDGSVIAVGAVGDQSFALRGSVSVFNKTGSLWSEVTKIVENDVQPGGVYGGRITLSADGNTMVVGAANDNTTSGNSAGSAWLYTFSGGTWSLTKFLNDPTTVEYAPDYYGYWVSVSADGNTLLITAYGDEPSGLTGTNGAANFYVI